MKQWSSKFLQWSFLAEQMTDLNDGYAFQELESRTNIHIKMDNPSLASGAEQFNLMLMSG
jgi:uncharacterized protein (DUF2132 family)